MTFTSPFIGNVVWTINGLAGGDAAHGTIDSAGVFRSPLVAPVDPVTIVAQLGTYSHAPSASATISIANPAPHVDRVSPTAVVVGQPSTIMLTGAGFNPSSQIVADGQALATTYIDSNHVSAFVPTGTLQANALVGVSVSNPPPGGGGSGQQTLAVIGGEVTATANPQVAAYRIQTPPGSSVRVDFGLDLNYGLQTSNVSAPTTGGVVRVLVAGMKAFSDYHMRAIVRLSDGTSIADGDHLFTTGGFPPEVVPTVQVIHFNPAIEANGIQLLDCLRASKLSLTAFDRDGQLIWAYYVPAELVTNYFPGKLLTNGTFLLVVNGIGVREIDLAGTTIRQFTHNQVDAALQSAEYSLPPITLHHDIQKFANGHYLLLGQITENIMLSGDSSPTAVTGDILVDLDPGLHVTWVWNSFDHLDVNRHPVSKTDWTHSNAIVLSADGNLLLSMRHQSWILKIDYQNGTGTGNVLWRLGYQGDFALQSSAGAADWFYMQHYPNVLSEQNGVLKLAVFDNGDNRILDPAGDTCGASGQIACYSRAVIFDVDQNAMTASVDYQHTLSQYSFWGGSVQQMPNGNYVAAMSNTPFGSRAEEFTGDAAETPVWQMDVIGTGSNLYRSFRLPSLYPGVTWR